MFVVSYRIVPYNIIIIEATTATVMCVVLLTKRKTKTMETGQT